MSTTRQTAQRHARFMPVSFPILMEAGNRIVSFIEDDSCQLDFQGENNE
jgi:hypothetical protein